MAETLWNIREDQIEQHELLGSGSYGSVFRVTWTKDGGEKVVAAGKYFRPFTDEDAKEIENEIRILSEIDHPNIIKYYGSVRGKMHTILVTEYAEGGSLRSYLKKKHEQKEKLPKTQALLWAYQAALALEHLHQEYFTHRDVKSNNLLITKDGDLKLCDFGFTKAMYSTQETTRKRGTLVYKSPELLRDGIVTSKIDVYAFGIVVWELFTCKTPYKDLNSDKVRCMVLAKKTPPIPADCSIHVKKLMAGCWLADRKERHDMGEVVACITHLRDHEKLKASVQGNTTNDEFEPAQHISGHQMMSRSSSTLQTNVTSANYTCKMIEGDDVKVGRVLHVIATAPSSESAESLAERVSQEAEVCITTGDEITHLAQSLYKWTLESPKRASHVAIVCNAFSKLEKDGVKFLIPFLQLTQKDFDTREDWRHGDENRWLSLACLLCQFFKEFKVDGTTLVVLEEPTLTCLEMLLASSKLKSHIYGVEQLLDLGPILYALKPYKIDEIMGDLHRRVLASDTLCTSRVIFLQALEFYAGGWQMDESTLDYYTNKRILIQKKHF